MRILVATPQPNAETNRWTDNDVSSLTQALSSKYSDLDFIPATMAWRRAASLVKGTEKDERYYNWAKYAATSKDAWNAPNYDEVWVPAIGFPSDDMYVGKATGLIVAMCLTEGKPVRLISLHEGYLTTSDVIDVMEMHGEPMHKFAKLVCETEE